MQERSNWTAGGQGGRKEPAKHQGGTRRQERTDWTAWEAPGKQERTKWTAWKGLIGQGGTREAGKDQLDRKFVKAILCHEEAFKGNPMLQESCQR